MALLRSYLQIALIKVASLINTAVRTCKMKRSDLLELRNVMKQISMVALQTVVALQTHLLHLLYWRTCFGCLGTLCKGEYGSGGVS